MDHARGNIFIRKMEQKEGFKADTLVETHTHNFDHVSVLFSGRWHARKWLPAVTETGEPVLDAGGQPQWLLVLDIERDGPWDLLIEAKARHSFRYLGMPVPAWMEPFLALLPPDKAQEFRELHNKSLGHGWCMYSHRSPQGDVTEYGTGWLEAYR